MDNKSKEEQHLEGLTYQELCCKEAAQVDALNELYKEISSMEKSIALIRELKETK